MVVLLAHAGEFIAPGRGLQFGPAKNGDPWTDVAVTCRVYRKNKILMSFLGVESLAVRKECHFVRRVIELAVLFLCLIVCLSPAYSQGQCTMQNIVGNYAFGFTGASTIVKDAAPDTLHWDALYAPIAGVGLYTIKPTGKADGFYWLVAGAWNFGLTPVPFHATVDLRADCTGSLTADFFGSPMVERFVILGNGREMRSVATLTASPTGNWLTTANRITGSCGQNKVHGDYLMECKNIFELPVDPNHPLDPHIFGGAIHIRMLISPGGDYTAKVYGKVGPDSTPFDAFGHITVNSDCTAEGTLATSFLPTVSHGRGVFFNEGKQAFWMPLVNTLTNNGVTNTFPQPYGSCLVTQVDNK
jgi:hypothetical protein